MLDSSTDLGKRPNVWSNWTKGIRISALAVVTKTNIVVTIVWQSGGRTLTI